MVSGIAVLRQMGPVSSIRNEAVERLKQHDVEGALRWLLEVGSAAGVPSLGALRSKRGTWSRLLRRLAPRGTPARSPDLLPLREGLESVLRAARSPGYADYLFHRFANPSLLGALPPLQVLAASLQAPRRRVVDLLSGAGHTSAVITALYPAAEVVAADSDFVNLFLTRHFTAPTVTAVCLDAELPLPFRDGTVDGLFCLDGLHYVRSKGALLQEVDRAVSAEGLWVFAHMHNALVFNVNPGAPLTPHGYFKRFSFARLRLMSESEVLKQFQTDGSLDLVAQPTMDALSSSNALILVGARTDAPWRRYEGLDDALCLRPDFLAFNPLYHVVAEGPDLVLSARWPSDALRAECTGVSPLLPETVRVPNRVGGEIVAARGGGGVSPEARALIRSFVLVCLPECYPRTDLP